LVYSGRLYDVINVIKNTKQKKLLQYGHEADGEVLSLPLVKIIAAIGHLQAKYCTENTCTKNLLCPEPAGGAYSAAQTTQLVRM